jgi:hypothetical protein
MKISTLTVLALACALPPARSQVIFDSYPRKSGIGAVYESAQSFYTASNVTLSNVVTSCSAQGAPRGTGDVWCFLFTDNGGQPGSSVLQFSNAVPGKFTGDVEFDAPPAFTLNSGYWWIVMQTGNMPDTTNIWNIGTTNGIEPYNYFEAFDPVINHWHVAGFGDLCMRVTAGPVPLSLSVVGLTIGETNSLFIQMTGADPAHTYQALQYTCLDGAPFVSDPFLGTDGVIEFDSTNTQLFLKIQDLGP